MMVKDVVFFLKHAFLEMLPLVKTVKTEHRILNHRRAGSARSPSRRGSA